MHDKKVEIVRIEICVCFEKIEIIKLKIKNRKIEITDR